MQTRVEVSPVKSIGRELCTCTVVWGVRVVIGVTVWSSYCERVAFVV